jgi:hypothetical protein
LSDLKELDRYVNLNGLGLVCKTNIAGSIPATYSIKVNQFSINITMNSYHLFNFILPLNLPQNTKYWIAGGAVIDWGSNTPNDYDIYFPNENEKTKMYDYLIQEGAKINHENKNRVQLIWNDKLFDLVKIYFDTPMDTINSFDFRVCQRAIDNEGKYHFIHSNDLYEKKLVINKITNVFSTIKRIAKYCKKGYSIDNSEIIKLITFIKENEISILPHYFLENSKPPL